MPDSSGEPDYIPLVLAWVQKRFPNATQITAVRPWGYDWAGDTEGGFYDAFSVSITYRIEDGSTTWWDVKGDDMESLWQAVVGDPYAQP